MWLKFNTVDDPAMLFDIREEDTSNRISLRVEAGEAILTLCDATIGTSDNILDNGMAETRMPLDLQANDWYHFMAAWGGTEYGKQGLLIDGFSHPDQKFEFVNPEGTVLQSELTGGLSPTSTSMALQDDGWLPSELTPLRIGNEVVLFGQGVSGVIRGARGTAATDHPSGAMVTPFGYSSLVQSGNLTADLGNINVTCSYDRIMTGGGTVSFSFGLNPIAVTDGSQQNPVTSTWFVDATEGDIPVNAVNIMDFPDQGYVTIDQEVIFYTSRSAGPLNGRGNGRSEL